jgi:hypothetical protein
VDLPKEVVVRVLSRGLAPAAAVWELERLSNIRAESRGVANKIQQIRAEAEAKISKLEARQICEHEYVESQGDPSGGSDRSYVCLVCDAHLPDRPDKAKPFRVRSRNEVSNRKVEEAGSAESELDSGGISGLE